MTRLWDETTGQGGVQLWDLSSRRAVPPPYQPDRPDNMPMIGRDNFQRVQDQIDALERRVQELEKRTKKSGSSQTDRAKSRIIMSGSKGSGYEAFDQLIAALKAEGYSAGAERLHLILHQTAWTTSSELLGELGREILVIQGAGHQWSVAIRDHFQDCMAVVRRVWPAIGS